jgi:hypothetical protein
MPEKGQTGVAKTVDIDSLSKDVAELAKQLGKNAEGPVDTEVLDRLKEKIEKIRSSTPSK